MSWSYFKSKLDQLNLDACAMELLLMFENLVPSESNVKIFHIANNDTTSTSIEPNHKNTTTMIFQWFTYIYQRNILSSIIKYILLKNILQKLNSSRLITTKKGCFSQMYIRLNEIIFEVIITAFNGSNYDNYLICNSLLIIITKLNQRMHTFKKGTSISTIKIIINDNINRFCNILQSKPQKKVKVIQSG